MDTGSQPQVTHTNAPAAVTPAQVFRFWRPLASTLLLMAIEAPIATAFITRRPDPELNLAAFGIAFGIGILLEAPVLRFLTAAISLVKDRQSYLSFQRFVFWQIGFATVLAIAIVCEPLYSILTDRMMGLSPELRELVRPALAVWVLFPAIVGYRRFLQGLLIRMHYPHRVAHGTAVRLVSTVAGLFAVSYCTALSGVMVAVLGIGIGVSAELVASIRFAKGATAELLRREHPPDRKALTPWQSAVFFYPLALSSLVLLCAQPLESFFVATSVLPLQSLALIPVLHGLLNPFTWSGYAIQDTSLAFLSRSAGDLAAVRTFAYRLAAGLVGLLGVIAVTPLAAYWYGHFNGISPELQELVRLPTFLVILQPGTTVWKAYLRGYLVHEKKTWLLLLNDFFEVVVFAVGLLVFTRYLPMTGITGAALAALVSGIAGCALISLYLRSGYSRTQ